MGTVAGGGEGPGTWLLIGRGSPHGVCGWGRVGAGCRKASRMQEETQPLRIRGSEDPDTSTQRTGGRERKSADEQQACEKVLEKVLGTQLNS